ncbi:carbohydrate-binding module family 43 protein, partial [Conidiobolus coronatus NRRL 28638]
GDDFKKLPDFDVYKKRLSDLKLSPANKSSYKAPSSSGTTCPTAGSNWKASNDLPPTPSVDACNCLVKSYDCIVNNSFNVSKPENKVGDIFKYACGEGKVDCTRFAADGENGKYGDLSFCDPSTQLSYAFNSMYKQSKNKDAYTEETCLKKSPNLEKAAGSNGGSGNGSNGAQFLLPSFGSLAIATFIASLFI